MFSNMERNADSATIRKTQRDFDINLLTFHVFAKHPHLPHFVQSIHNRPFYIVFRLYVHDNLFADGRIDFQSSQSLKVLSPVITENDVKHLNLNVIFSFCREIIGEKKNFCLVTNPRNKLIY